MTQLRTDVQRREPSPFCQRMQQGCLARLGRTKEQNELAVQSPKFIDQAIQFFDHRRLLPARARRRRRMHVES